LDQLVRACDVHIVHLFLVEMLASFKEPLASEQHIIADSYRPSGPDQLAI
jgi:hypothetical protein